jgi:hypothetical protein
MACCGDDLVLLPNAASAALHVCACDAKVCCFAAPMDVRPRAVALPTEAALRDVISRVDGVGAALARNVAVAQAKAADAASSQRKRRRTRAETPDDGDDLLTFPELPPSRRCHVCGGMAAMCPCRRDAERVRAAAGAERAGDDPGDFLDDG